MQIRACAAAAVLLLAAGCVTPAGIIDDWRPPQAQGTTADQRIVCEPAETKDQTETAVEVAPCVAEVVSLVATQAPQPLQPKARRPSPPRRWR
ncbi:MAG TPA: hypothetical protein VGF48_00665 [Thermoanaerobaculia bacterium]|jgi:hypothetical protein